MFLLEVWASATVVHYQALSDTSWGGANGQSGVSGSVCHLHRKSFPMLEACPLTLSRVHPEIAALLKQRVDPSLLQPLCAQHRLLAWL